MAAALEWTGDDEEPVPASFPSSQHRTRGRRTPARPGDLPPDIEAAIWRGDQLGSPVTRVISSGFAALDKELPGAGWPCHSLTEILQPQPTVAEWRLLAPAMRQVVANGGHVVVVGPPKAPHLPGLKYAGLDERQLVWIHAEAPAERLWVTEQLIKTNASGLLVSWLPQARQEQIRRLQVCAQSCDGPVFLCRPAAAEHEPSAAPLRVQLTFGVDWELHVHLLKRKGPTHEGNVTLRSIPGGLEAILTPRLKTPSTLIASRRARDEQPHAVGRPAPGEPAVRRVAAH
jgi:protein ImuA